MLNPNIILAGQGVDAIGAMGRGTQLAAQTNALRTQNDLANLYRTQGAGILAGDQGALNALAGIDPMSALNVQTTRQGMTENARRLEILNAQEQRAIEEYKAGKTAAELAAEAQKIEDAVKMGLAIQDPAQWDAVMAQQAPDLVGQFNNRQALAMKYMSVAEAFKIANPEPQKPADEYQRYAQEETAAGRTPLTRLEFEQAKKGKGITYTTTDANGNTTTFSMGGRATDPNTPMLGEVYNPGEASNAVTLIDEILGSNLTGDEAATHNQVFERVTGPLAGGGGNNIDDLNWVQRMYYGGDGTALVEKIGQLQSQAWLSAREMLKGGGAITDYESRKAEAAVARLSRAKDPADLRQALQDLRDAITEGEAKLRAARGGQPATPPASLSDDELLNLYGGE